MSNGNSYCLGEEWRTLPWVLRVQVPQHQVSNRP
jgi:hypothetical protein